MARSSSSDALEKFRFLVDFTYPQTDSTTGTGAVRCGFHDVQMPKRSTNKIMYREGHDLAINTKSAGLSDFEDVVMSRGVISADGSAVGDFLKWCSAIHKPSAGISGYTGTEGKTSSEADFINYRGEVTITMLGRDGKAARAWKLHQAWPSNFVPGSDLNAGEDGEKSMEALTITYEDFQELKVSNGVVGTDTL